jgi:regulation of enolase protein 1 (concanavalin A-like superfamily)
MTRTVPWSDGSWTNDPVDVTTSDDGLHVTAREGSDAWRITSYDFIHSTEHALLATFEPESAIEVQFRLDFAEQFDQAGIFVKVDDESWIKAGVELSDGEESLGAVVTRGTSDWSLSPVPAWSGRLVTVRGSWSGNALTVRARVDDEPWRLVRVAPLVADGPVTAGPFCCAPTRAGFTVHFTSWRITPPDAGLHPGA